MSVPSCTSTMRIYFGEECTEIRGAPFLRAGSKTLRFIQDAVRPEGTGAGSIDTDRLLIGINFKACTAVVSTQEASIPEGGVPVVVHFWDRCPKITLIIHSVLAATAQAQVMKAIARSHASPKAEFVTISSANLTAVINASKVSTAVVEKE